MTSPYPFGYPDYLTKIHVADSATFEQKLAAIRAAGRQRVHLIADFDRTMTPMSIGDRTPSTSWGIFDPILSAEHKADRLKLYRQYHPMEHDVIGMSLDKRSRHMCDWVEKHLALLVAEGLTAGIMRRAVEVERAVLRDRTTDVLGFCSEHSIPFLIMSAGLGDIIQMIMESLGQLTPNMHIVSNFFTFDSHGKVTGFMHDFVHVLNKNQSHVRHAAYAAQLASRPNAILLGDNPGDATMADGMPSENVLRIGFVNSNHGDLTTFEKAFDVLILDDGSMEFVHDLLLSIE